MDKPLSAFSDTYKIKMEREVVTPLKVACRVQIWKKHFVKIVTILVTVLLKMTYNTC